MNRVVITGAGYVNPAGIGSAGSELFVSDVPRAEARPLANGKTHIEYQLPDLSGLPDYPDRKTRRYMRPESIYAMIAASLAIRDAGIEERSHDMTALYTAAGQCYSDMWPFIRNGVVAAMDDEIFDIQQFGRVGMSRINPFFSIRTLGALPAAIIAQKYAVRGENAAFSSFGAESVELLHKAAADIENGNVSCALVGSFQYTGNRIEIENLYSNGFYSGDFHSSPSASFIVMESEDHCRTRNGKVLGVIEAVAIKYRQVALSQRINYDKDLFIHLIPDEQFGGIDHVIVHPSGTAKNFEAELSASQNLFKNSTVASYFNTLGTLLAGAEPFGIIRMVLAKEPAKKGITLSRSIGGLEGAVVISCGGLQ